MECSDCIGSEMFSKVNASFRSDQVYIIDGFGTQVASRKSIVIQNDKVHVSLVDKSGWHTARI